MSYFNPDFYKYDALLPEDKKILDGYDRAVEEVGNRDFLLDEMLGMTNESMHGQLQRETAEAVLDKLEEVLEMSRVELIASIMDSDDRYMEEEHND